MNQIYFCIYSVLYKNLTKKVLFDVACSSNEPPVLDFLLESDEFLMRTPKYLNEM
jgi:hypothetical protein